MSEIFGARARVFMRYDGGIKELAKKISNGLILPDLAVDFSEYPPYELTGMGEALGFEFWLKTVLPDDGNSFVDGYNYVFEMSTELSDDEIMNDRMYDLSLWLGRLVSIICDLDTCVLNEDNNLTVFRSKKVIEQTVSTQQANSTQQSGTTQEADSIQRTKP